MKDNTYNLNSKLSDSDIDAFFSEEAQQAKSSIIRLVVGYASKPGFVSLGGGLPDPLTFPVNELNDAWEQNIELDPDIMFQYGKTQGVDSYLDAAKNFLERTENIIIDPTSSKYNNNIFSTVGSQLALKLISEVFINKGDKLIMGRPTYLGGLAAFKLNQPEFIGVPVDENGLVTDSLEERLDSIKNKDDMDRIKFAYVVPDFQNPAGVTLSLDRRKKLIDLADKYNFLILEDAPYRKLRYEGEELPLIYNIAQERGSNRVILLETLSKILAPGLRQGLIVADNKIIDKINKLKQATVLCGPPLTQLLATPLLKEGLEEHIEDAKILYHNKRDRMIESLEKYMPKGVVWNKPHGGIFLWLKTPLTVDSEDKIIELIEKYKVVFIPGSAFDCTGGSGNYMRLNFSYPKGEEIDEGVKRLAKLIKNETKG